MSRRSLTELDVLERLLAQGCYSVNWPTNNLEESISINRKADKRLLTHPTTRDFLAGDASVVLEETKHVGINASLLEQVTIAGLNVETLVLKPDNFAVQHYKGGTWNKACDYLVLTEFDSKKYAIFIDLKTSIGCDPADDGSLIFQGSEYDSDMVWQMLGADLLFNGLLNTAYLRTRYYIENTQRRAKSYKSEMKICCQTPLSSYNRRYLILYMNKKIRTSTTSGGIQSTGACAPNDACLESRVLAKQVANKEVINIGDIVSFVGRANR